MPAISVDTFFACSLMVLLVLSAMASASKLLYPHINNKSYDNAAKRYREISKYMLLNHGTPSNWGEDGQTVPEKFGLADAHSDYPYELDIDKVSRLNSENAYALSYAQMFTALKMPDASFSIEIKPTFEVILNLTATYQFASETVYQFEISTEKHGVPVEAELKCYTVAENYLGGNYVNFSDGKTALNVTLQNSVVGPALFSVLARAICNAKIVSFGVYAFAHNSPEPKPNGTFLRLSPLNYTLDVAFIYSGINLSRAYALTFNYSSTLTQTSISNQSATYSVPHFLDADPTLTIVTGWNSTVFFAEWTAYPQIPLQTGADFADSVTLSNVFTYTYTITINSALYECTVRLGGPRE